MKGLFSWLEASVNMERVLVWSVIFGAGLLCSFPVVAAAQVGKIVGVVQASDGAPLDGAIVTLTGANVTVQHKITDDTGHYEFLNLPSGFQLK